MTADHKAAQDDMVMVPREQLEEMIRFLGYAEWGTHEDAADQWGAFINRWYPEIKAMISATLAPSQDAPAAPDATPENIVSRITAYLSGGGLFNPEMANHDAVRDLLIDCRDELRQRNALRAKLAQTEARYCWAANELLSADYGDNEFVHTEQNRNGWIVWGWRVKGVDRMPHNKRPRIWGDSIDAAIDTALRGKEKGHE